MNFFRLPTKVVMAAGCIKQVGHVCATLNAGVVLLVHDPGLGGSTSLDAVTGAAEAEGVTLHLWSEVESNPRTTTVETLAAHARQLEVQALIGMGGGSVLDAAKAAAMLAANEGLLLDYVGRDRYAHPPLPFVAMPTTCGTGSEVTWVAVVTARDQGLKVSVKGESMFPDYALVDPDTLVTLPDQVVAWTSLDALTHAIEAYTCTRANPASDALAREAMRLIFRHLRDGYADIAGRPAAREGLMRAATLAGMAFGNADVAAVHCLSETIGGRFDVPHGLANAILLVPVMRYQRAHTKTRLAELAEVCGAPAAGHADPGRRADMFIEAVERLVTDVSIPPFSSLQIDPRHFDWIAVQAAANGSNASNPQPMTPADYAGILATC